MCLPQGAIECLEKGVRSSLNKANAKHVDRIANPSSKGDVPLSLLFDPQTSGGLLAFVPENAAAMCVADLKAAGYPHTAVVGVTRAAPPVPEGACGMPPIRLV